MKYCWETGLFLCTLRRALPFICVNFFKNPEMFQRVLYFKNTFLQKMKGILEQGSDWPFTCRAAKLNGTVFSGCCCEGGHQMWLDPAETTVTV